MGRVLRSLPQGLSANIVKIERTVVYDEYLDGEYAKLDALKKSYEKGFITEDELKKATDEVQKLTDRYVATVDKKCQSKEKEIMDI